MYNRKRFYVTIPREELQGKGELLETLDNFRQDIEDPDTLFEFEDWVLEALGSFLKTLAPTPAPGTNEALTLFDYFSPPTYAFRLINEGGSLCGIQEIWDPKSYGDSSPRTRIVDEAQSCHPDDAELPLILRSALPATPVFLASELEKVDEGGPAEDESDVPKKVSPIGSDAVFFFKPGYRSHGHLRELEILSIIESNKFAPPFYTSKLAGLVIWDHDSSCLMGFLLEYIEGGTLAGRMGTAAVEEKNKWMDQIEATMGRLHGAGVVCGDVKPDNIMINKDGNAVAIDFGGGYNPAYIDAKLYQTREGDLMALGHMRKEMGI
ncbi:hypothetical protein AK830_g12553 [Neonectria ditissima]|uniref:Protein kinase domain-containing protein n=1 Tax=Neonectria ditissima TaxID=78410 RepID=A0A0P7B0A0_9HYPO|nr:hypothetical protein AK830_g12553 [Neonectria ditissima]